MTYSEKVQFFIKEYILAADIGRCKDIGGYHSAWKVMNGYIFVASVDHRGAPVLSIYKNKDVVNWTSRTITFLKSEVGEEETLDLLDAYAMTRVETLSPEKQIFAFKKR